jgi:Trp operon repressor
MTPEEKENFATRVSIIKELLKKKNAAGHRRALEHQHHQNHTRIECVEAARLAKN